jgi:hypothetical protein
MHDLESFANERHPFVKRSILEALPTERYWKMFPAVPAENVVPKAARFMM